MAYRIETTRPKSGLRVSLMVKDIRTFTENRDGSCCVHFENGNVLQVAMTYEELEARIGAYTSAQKKEEMPHDDHNPFEDSAGLAGEYAPPAGIRLRAPTSPRRLPKITRRSKRAGAKDGAQQPDV